VPDDVRMTGTFETVGSVVGRGVIAPFVPNEPLVTQKLAPLDAGGGMPPAIPPGMRAMAVKVNDVIGVAGFTVPGTHVDVVATVRSEKENVSRVVLSNVQVLAAGTNQEQTQNNEPIRATVVTLLVTPSDAERLALAMNEGQISLALRNPLDINATTTNGVRMSGLVANPSVAATPTVKSGPRGTPAAAAAPAAVPVVVVTPAPPSPYTVQVFRGASRTDEIIK